MTRRWFARSPRRSACLPVVARLLCQRGLQRPGGGPPLSLARPEPTPRSVSADRHAPGGRPAAGGGRARRVDRHSRRLRRGRHHRHGHPAPRDRARRRQGHALRAGPPQGRLRSAAGDGRTAARGGRRADRVGGLRHPRRRSGGAGAGPGHRSHHHRPSRARCRAAARLRGHQSRSERTARIRTSIWPASASR